MALCYAENEPPRGPYTGQPIMEWSEDRVMGAWLEHRKNHHFLTFMLRRGTFQEKAAATRELTVCQRKLAFWEKHPEFNKAEASAANARLAKQWAGR